MTHDTEPDSAPSPSSEHDASDRTEPGPPPSAVVPPRPTGLAADLLDHLSDAPLPQDGIAETKGHDAARFAVAPHAPPRRAREHDEAASVLVNVTAPLPAPRAEHARVVGLIDLPAAGEAERTVLTRDKHAARETTRGRQLVIGVSFGIVAVAALVAAAIVIPRGRTVPSQGDPQSPTSVQPAASLAPSSSAAASPSAAVPLSTVVVAPSIAPPAKPSPSSLRPLLTAGAASSSRPAPMRNANPAAVPSSAPSPTSSYNRFLEDDRK